METKNICVATTDHRISRMGLSDWSCSRGVSAEKPVLGAKIAQIPYAPLGAASACPGTGTTQSMFAIESHCGTKTRRRYYCCFHFFFKANPAWAGLSVSEEILQTL